MENTRVSELAKELGMTSKEVIEKFAEIDIAVKSHSNVVSPQQIRRLREQLGQKSGVPAKKPKAFVVKKTKPAETEEVTKPEIKEGKKASKPLIEVVKRKEVIQQEPPKAEVKPSEEPKEEAPIEKKPIKVERTRIEYPERKTSRIEIVRKAPPKPLIETKIEFVEESQKDMDTYSSWDEALEDW
jgi:translation initiation factor IF-2